MDERFGFLGSVVLSCDSDPVWAPHPPGLFGLTLVGLALGVIGTDTEMRFMLFAALCVMKCFVSEPGVIRLLVGSTKLGSELLSLHVGSSLGPFTV